MPRSIIRCSDNYGRTPQYLLFHGVIILLLALLAVISYGKAILKKETDNIIFAWRVAHSTLSISAILMLTLTPILSLINIDLKLKRSIAILFIISGYAFSFALCLAPIVGHRGLAYKAPFPAKLVYPGNLIGALTSLLGLFFYCLLHGKLFEAYLPLIHS